MAFSSPHKQSYSDNGKDSSQMNDHEEGQSLFLPEPEEADNADPNEFDERPAACEPIGPTPNFDLVTEFFEMIQEMRGKRHPGGAKGIAEKKRSLVSNLFKKWKENVGNDLYPLVRLLLPDRDRYRATYGVKEQVFAKIYTEVLGLSRHSAAAETLLKWKQPTDRNKTSGDFAETAFGEISVRSLVDKASLSIEAVNDLLDQLSQTNKQEGKVKIVNVFNEKLTALDQKWLIRIVLKELKISLGEKLVLSCIHQDANDLFNICSDLRAVCWKLWNQKERLPNEDNTVQLFRAFRPMLCNRSKVDFADIAKKMGSVGKNKKEFFIEEKLDGERIQLHRKGEEYRYYSRKDKDYTNLYGNSRASKGSLTPYIHGAIASEIEELILDGEMLVRDPDTGLYLPFGTLKTHALGHHTTSATVCYKIFDILYVKAKGRNGIATLSYPLRERRKLIDRFIKPIFGRIEHATGWPGHTGQDIKDKLEYILDKQGEGLVVKNLESLYTLHGREDDWIKVKPEYMDALGEEVDVLVMGGFWGSGHRGGTLGSFMCGVRDDRPDGSTVYYSFCKVGSGLNLADFNDIKEKLHGKSREWQKGMADPVNYIFGAEKPDVWIKPEDSFMIAVKAAEIVADSENYGAEVCLRFPRVQKIRWDLGPEDCHKYQEDFLTVASSQRSSRPAMADSFLKRRQIAPRNPKASVLSSMQGAQISDKTAESDIFKGCKFFVVEGLYELGKEVPEFNKQELEKQIVKNGGQRWQDPQQGEDSFVICSRLDFMRIKNIVKKKFDVIHPLWLINCIEAKKRLPLLQGYYVHLTEATALTLPEDPASDEEALPMPPISTSREALFKSESHRSTSPEERRAAKKGRKNGGRAEPAKSVKREESDESEGDETEASTASDSDEPEGPFGVARLRSVTQKDESEQEDEPEPDNATPEPSVDAQAKEESESPQKQIAQSGLGAFTSENQYDQEQIFRHLTFYLDTSGNASKNNVVSSGEATPSASQTTLYDTKLKNTGSLLVEHGGKVTDDLEEPSLTHIIVSKDTSRVKELSRRTRQPRSRRITTIQWVEDSVEQEDLQEESFYPAYVA